MSPMDRVAEGHCVSFILSILRPHNTRLGNTLALTVSKTHTKFEVHWTSGLRVMFVAEKEMDKVNAERCSLHLQTEKCEKGDATRKATTNAMLLFFLTQLHMRFPSLTGLH